jgi:chorismate synthase
MRFELLQALLDKLMAKQPKDRFDSAAAALVEIRKHIDAMGIAIEVQHQPVPAGGGSAST